MKRADLVEKLRAHGSEYQARLAQRSLGSVAPDDDRAFDALAGLLVYKGATALPEIVDMAGRIASVPLGFDAIQASITERYPIDAMQIMREAMKAGPVRLR